MLNLPYKNFFVHFHETLTGSSAIPKACPILSFAMQIKNYIAMQNNKAFFNLASPFNRKNDSNCHC